MKTKLIRLLAVCGLAVSLGACSNGGGSKAKVATLAEANEWNYETRSAALEGELLRIEDVIVSAAYGNNVLTVSSYSQTPDGRYENLQAIEVTTKTPTDFYWKDIVTVEGTVTTVDGRITLANADVDWGTGGEAACKDAGAVIYHICDSRLLWDHNAGRENSSHWVEVDVQLASVPVAKADEASSFYVAFPGENLNLEDAGNIAPIEVIIPAGLGEEKAQELNSFFAKDGWEVGTGVKLFAQFYFQTYTKLILPYVSFQLEQNYTTFLENYYLTWGNKQTPDTAAFRVNDFIVAELPDLGSELAQSYTVNPLLFEGNGIMLVNANPGSSNEQEPLFNALVNKTKDYIAAGHVDWEFLGEAVDQETNEPLATFVRKVPNEKDPENGEPEVVTLVQFVLSNAGYVNIAIQSLEINEGGIALTDAAADKIEEGKNAQDILNTIYQNHIVSHAGIYGFMGSEEMLKTWATKMPSFASAGGELYKNSMLIWANWDALDGTDSLIYNYLFVHSLAHADAATPVTEDEVKTALQAYIVELNAAGYVSATLSKEALGKDVIGLWNATTNEFLMPQASVATEELPASVVISLLYVHPTLAQKLITVNE